MRRDGGAFEQRVRRPAHDLAVLERSRLGFVRVHAQVVRLLLLLGHEGPLEPRRETGTAPPAEPRFLHDVDDPGRLHREGLREHLVATPQAPRHSTSITVHLPSGLVAPSSLAPVASRSAFTTDSAPQILHGDVVHTCTKYLPTGCW